MDAIFGASILASFLAGIVALFAPCCITVLLPAYIASAFREKRNILKMTLIFFAGIATILVPIGLGAAGLAQLFTDFHEGLWIVGGLFMIVLAALAFRGKGLSLPFSKRLKEKLATETGNHTKSVYALGVLSGAATSCCAPVLAGAMALAIVSASFWKALVVVFAYVFGMVFPLFLTAYCYDRFKVEQSRFIQGKLLTIPLGARKVTVHSTNLIAAIVFLAIGVTMFVLGVSGSAYWSPSHQVTIGESLNDLSLRIFSSASVIPDAVWGVLIVVLFALLVVSLKRKKKRDGTEEPHSCH